MDHTDPERSDYLKAAARLRHRIRELALERDLVLTLDGIALDEGTSKTVPARHKVVIRTGHRESSPVYIAHNELMAPVLDWDAEGRLKAAIRELAQSAG